MTVQSLTTERGPSAARGAVLLARVLAVASALFWGVLFFGIIDLSVVVMQDWRFHEHYLLEAGWGLLYTGLVMLPLLVWAAVPRCVVLLQEVLAVAVAVFVTGLAALAPGQLVPAVFLALSALVPALLARLPLSLPSVQPRRVHPLLASLVALALAGGVAYAVAMIRAAYAGVPDDNTWGLMHLPMQAALALALPAVVAVVALAHAAGQPRWRVGLAFPAITAAGLGAVSVAYPDHLGSLGLVGGAVCLAWAVALGASGFVLRDAAV
jgi:hypothetical protein